MPLHKKLIPTSEKEILDEIAKELNIPLRDVTKTYGIWIKYLDDINDNTDQSTINFPGLGKMFISYARLKGNVEYDWEKRKKERIEKDIPADKINHHKSIVPVNIIYGVGRKNHKLGRNIRGKFDFFTKEELIRRQNINFFKEDQQFNDRSDIFEEYFNEIKEQELENYEHPKNIKSKIQEQGQYEGD